MNPEMMDEFVRGGGAKRGARPKKPKGLQRGKGLNPQSDKQKIRQAFLAGIKAERLRVQFKRLGDPQCESCQKFLDIPEHIDTEQEWVEEAMSLLDGHHVVSRDKGTGYRGPKDQGVDSPINIILLCRTCHAATEPEPEWT